MSGRLTRRPRGKGDIDWAEPGKRRRPECRAREMAWKPHTAEAFTGETWHGRPGYDPDPGQIPLSTGGTPVPRAWRKLTEL